MYPSTPLLRAGLLALALPGLTLSATGAHAGADAGAAGLQDLAGKPGNVGENTLMERGFSLSGSTHPAAGVSVQHWRRNGECVEVVSEGGVYQSIIDAPAGACD